ncbi:putative low molecular weight phosphotyrosine protein phosphatase [Kockovaella imperatae]|uniref:Putative low molecular weight phosphotyrosine protein phosphatase n=1 Tax=Kockovaella imperatae TaxID=4999 RepID=A0A1Y1U5Y0_9TREE|nr:putative low molecular weight phosphotyrosine protein phosphatase [Kockovaella imperatae]ORX33438.1 putative low molecular weight phosphotyrosine protein phosphatase [Kockovaella imperatae]
MAEAILIDRLSKRGSASKILDITVDSAGTGAYHAGEPADERTITTCQKHGVPVTSIARRLTPEDYAKFDYILAMDESNLDTIRQRKPPSSKCSISLFGSYDSSAGRSRTIDDPYYGGRRGFEEAYEQCVRFADGFLDHLEKAE